MLALMAAPRRVVPRTMFTKKAIAIADHVRLEIRQHIEGVARVTEFHCFADRDEPPEHIGQLQRLFHAALLYARSTWRCRPTTASTS